MEKLQQIRLVSTQCIPIPLNSNIFSIRELDFTGSFAQVSSNFRKSLTSARLDGNAID
jgi:hypothetical protein